MSKNNGQDISRSSALRRIEHALRSPVPSERERLLYYQLTVEGQPEDAVAGRFGLTIDALRFVVRRVERWMSLIDMPIDARNTLARHLARLEHQWRLAMNAWHRSCEEEVIVKTTVETTPGKDKTEAGKDAPESDVCPAKKAAHRRAACATEEIKKVKTERTTRRGCGDVRYLEQARKIMAEIRALSAAAEEQAQENAKQEPAHVDELSPHQRITEVAQRIAQIREDAAQPEAEDQ